MAGAVAGLPLAQRFETAGFSFDGERDQIGDTFLPQQGEDGRAGKAFIQVGAPDAQPDGFCLPQQPVDDLVHRFIRPYKGRIGMKAGGTRAGLAPPNFFVDLSGLPIIGNLDQVDPDVVAFAVDPLRQGGRKPLR